MNKLLAISIVSFLLSLNALAADTLVWVGNSDAEFFSASSWILKSNGTSPNPDILHKDSLIHINLEINNAQLDNPLLHLRFSSDSLGLDILNSDISLGYLQKGKISIAGVSKLVITGENPMQGNVTIDMLSPEAWVCFPNENPDVTRFYFYQFLARGNRPVLDETLTLDQYHAGSLFRLVDTDYKPLTMYTDLDFEGDSSAVVVNKVVGINDLSANVSGNMMSLQLKRGYMVCLAVNPDGTGLSKIYIASEKDLKISSLPPGLQKRVHFIRVLPWNWVLKKGVGGNIDGVDQSWYYNWGNGSQSTFTKEYAPMSWGIGGANDDGDIQKYRNKANVTHVLGFNESDNCNDQSGQYGSLCVIDTAVKYYKNLMKTGLRLGSPAPRENGPFGWLSDFMDEATAQNVRIDVMCVHWYDWGSNPKVNTSPTPQQVFNRFKNYLQRVYDKYGLPIWITEFNANPNRNNTINVEFMKLALPYLEELEYVERYAYFQPNSKVADYFDSEKNYTNMGTLYKTHVSTPAIPEETVSSVSNLDVKLNEVPAQDGNLLINGDFETGTTSSWNGTNIGTLNTASTFEGNFSGRILAGAGNISQSVTVKPESHYKISVYHRWYVESDEPITATIRDATNDELIQTFTLTATTQWTLFEHTFSTGQSTNRIQIEFSKQATSPGWFLDKAILIEGNFSSLDQQKKDEMIHVFPNPVSTILHIKNSVNESDIQIFGLDGTLLFFGQTTGQQINLSNLKQGIYILCLDKSTFIKLYKS